MRGALGSKAVNDTDSDAVRGSFGANFVMAINDADSDAVSAGCKTRSMDAIAGLVDAVNLHARDVRGCIVVTVLCCTVIVILRGGSD
jgi:hypothetical protein